ncbi:hypothetical protein [Streptomyces sp. NBC_01233]|uniref:hypothetical protein n=1 Tax=Streptomyces sp. NBC_01233 TaxID=2903787 RepID=UPI002E113844|nr:hypothetical protein OG332_30075 [Streptomyces sp. NBC_01233]
MATIDITGLEPAAVVAALYNHAQPVGLGMAAEGSDRQLNVDEARRLLDEVPTISVRQAPPSDLPYADAFGNLFINYLQGRPMYVSITGSELDTGRYDRDHGDGAAERIVEDLKQTREATTSADLDAATGADA